MTPEELLENPDFAAAFAEFNRWRNEELVKTNPKVKKTTPTGEHRMVIKLAKLDDVTLAIACLNDSIDNGWQGTAFPSQVSRLIEALPEGTRWGREPKERDFTAEYRARLDGIAASLPADFAAQVLALDPAMGTGALEEALQKIERNLMVKLKLSLDEETRRAYDTRIEGLMDRLGMEPEYEKRTRRNLWRQHLRLHFGVEQITLVG
jgi:hypothetical protein